MLTRSLIQQRVRAGQDEHAARIAKSSVHDAFRLGRSRINERLVRELARVLGGDDELVDRWLELCAQPTTSAAQPELPDRPAQPELPAQPDAVPARATGSAPTAPPTAPHTASPDSALTGLLTASLRQQLLLAVACVVRNLLGRGFVDLFRLPIHLDMVGTAIAAIALGPWRGAAVGGLTNVLGVVGSGWVSLPFAAVNIVGALVWGYGVRRFGMGRTLPRFFTLNVLTAFACSMVAVPILAVLLGSDGLRDGHDVIIDLLGETIDQFLLALGFANLLTSLGDKLVSGFVALVVISALPLAFRASLRLVLVDAEPRRD